MLELFNTITCLNCKSRINKIVNSNDVNTDYYTCSCTFIGYKNNDCIILYYDYTNIWFIELNSISIMIDKNQNKIKVYNNDYDLIIKDYSNIIFNSFEELLEELQSLLDLLRRYLNNLLFQ